MGDWKMFQLVKNYFEKMSKKDLNDFAIKNGVYLSESELDFTYNFVKRNYETLYANPNIDLTKYKSHYSDENFSKMMKLIMQYKTKYASFLN